MESCRDQSMITFLIGHRGVGKTHLLKRIQKYLKNEKSLQFWDLDQEIEKRKETKVYDLFSLIGEAKFRELEREILNDVLSETHGRGFIALGAGFEGELPVNSQVLWVRRLSDQKGRSFLDRPRLQKEKKPLEEFRERYQERQKKYRRQSQQSLILREGVKGYDEAERDFFVEEYIEKKGAWTLLSGGDLSKPFQLPFEFVELRDDLLSEEEMEHSFTMFKEDQVLYSYRKESRKNKKVEGCKTDWPLELGEPFFTPTIISAHERFSEEELSHFFQRLEKFEEQVEWVKAAPEIHSFRELHEGYLWQQKKPNKRSFLPRSNGGRWKWFRLFMKYKTPLNFWKDDEGSAIDQPTLLEWLSAPKKFSAFAAVLGHPIDHSWTPAEQQSFFAKRKMPVFAIPVLEDEFYEACRFLQEIGLKAAAVTSPLKKQAFDLSDVKTNTAKELQSVNTLFFSKDKKVFGHNTDLAGFSYLVSKQELPSPIAIWGGGGTLEMMKEILPQAIPYSVRTGQKRKSMIGVQEEEPIKTVVWANSQIDIPDSWRPEQVIDLSYTDDSLAREFAVHNRCRYTSGEAMFKKQAEEQRHYWQELFAKEQV